MSIHTSQQFAELTELDLARDTFVALRRERA
jgi:hypothetical protein